MSNQSTLDWEAFDSGPVNGMAVRLSVARELESKLNTALRRNKELVEALKLCDYGFGKHCPDDDSTYGESWAAVRSALYKHKEEA